MKMHVNARDSQTSDWCSFSWGVHEVSLLLYPSCPSFPHLAHTFWVRTAELFESDFATWRKHRKQRIQSLISIALVKVKGTQITKFEERYVFTVSYGWLNVQKTNLFKTRLDHFIVQQCILISTKGVWRVAWSKLLIRFTINSLFPLGSLRKKVIVFSESFEITRNYFREILS